MIENSSEASGKINGPMPRAESQSESCLLQIKEWLRAGATIKARDTNGRILEYMGDGRWYGGLNISFPEKPDK